MASLLTSVELWVGLALLLGLALFATAGGDKKAEARLARATRKTAGAPAQATASLRRRDPSAETPFGQLLAGMSSIAKLKARFEVAGMPDMTAQKFIGIMAGIAAGVFLVLVVLLGKPVAVSLLAGLVLGMGIPHVRVAMRIRKRQKLFLKLFPDAIDLMVRGLRAGLPIGESFHTISREIPEPVGPLFAIISQQTALGVPMEKALADTATKLGLTEFNFFVTSIILQRETGGNLGEILSNLAEMLRARQMMKLKIGALSSEARASAYIVGCLPFAVMLMLQLISPDYLKPLFNDYRGNLWLLAAMSSIGLGGFIMLKMSQLEI